MCYKNPLLAGFLLVALNNFLCYNYIMKSISFVIPQPRKRAHQALFDRDLPFRGRREQSKLAYRRKSKHPLREPA